MNVIHNIALSAGSKEQAAFKAAGVNLETGFTSFKIDENDSRWLDVQALVRKFQAVDTASTNFTAAELMKARYLGIAPTWHHGYPEPANDFGYLNLTFDLKDYCKVCGVGKKQIAPFRLKKAPAWGAKSILQLNWIFDEYFVTPTVWERIFAPIGVAARPVIFDKTGEEIDSIVQLTISSVTDLEFDGAYEKCSCCGRNKFLPISKGFYPAIKIEEKGIFKSSQYFGSGASAHQMVMVSNLLYKEIKSAGLKGIEFIPCLEI